WAWRGASIALAIAEKARAIATFIANTIATMGVGAAVMLAAVGAGVAALAMHFAGVFQEGGIVPRTGWAYVHQGEIIVPPRKLGVLTANITVNVNNPVFSRDYDVDRMMERIILRLKRAGVPFD
ncbi:hypothetical protein DRO19_02525, partial [Candidatus Bathyarchaeota archaeon]